MMRIAANGNGNILLVEACQYPWAWIGSIGFLLVNPACVDFYDCARRADEVNCLLNFLLIPGFAFTEKFPVDILNFYFIQVANNGWTGC